MKKRVNFSIITGISLFILYHTPSMCSRKQECIQQIDGQKYEYDLETPMEREQFEQEIEDDTQEENEGLTFERAKKVICISTGLCIAWSGALAMILILAHVT